MKTIRNRLCLLLAAGLILGLGACSQEEPVSSEVPVSSAASAEESAVSLEPEPEEWFTPAGDLIPDAPEEGAEGFEADFSQNSIDKKYDADYAQALSFSTMRQACDEAAANWKSMVTTAYQEALYVLSGQERTSLQEDQDIWEREIGEEVRTMEAEAGTDNEAILTAAKQKVLLYRQRAMELCRIKYEADGELPEFPKF